MKTLFCLICLIFGTSLFATVNEPLRWEFFTGYRNDRIHWHMQDPGDSGALTYSEVYRDVQYWLNGLTLKVIHRDLTFFLRGAYGAFGKGTLTQRYASLPSEPHFDFSTNGWSADVSGYFGYSVNLTADRTYKVILTPLIGYSGYFEELKRGSVSPSSIGTLSSSLPGVFRLVWNGVFVGGQFIFETGGPVILNAGYAYNLMHNRTHTQIEQADGAVSTRQSVKTSSGGNGGQSGWAQFDWMINYHWRLGFGGNIHYFTTRVVDAAVSETGRGDLSQKFKLRWTPISAWGQLSRSF